jgi:hypothetical protein
MVLPAPAFTPLVRVKVARVIQRKYHTKSRAPQSSLCSIQPALEDTRLQKPFPSSFLVPVEEITLFGRKIQRGHPAHDIAISLVWRKMVFNVTYHWGILKAGAWPSPFCNSSTPSATATPVISSLIARDNPLCTISTYNQATRSKLTCGHPEAPD